MIHIIDRKRNIEKDLGNKLRDKINDKKFRERINTCANSVTKQGEKQYKKRNIININIKIFIIIKNEIKLICVNIYI